MPPRSYQAHVRELTPVDNIICHILLWTNEFSQCILAVKAIFRLPSGYFKRLNSRIYYALLQKLQLRVGTQLDVIAYFPLCTIKQKLPVHYRQHSGVIVMAIV